MTVRERTCATADCGTTFRPGHNRQLACSPECSRELKLKRQRQRKRQPAYLERDRERRQEPANVERQRELQRKVNGVMCHHCYGRFRPEGRERYCSVSCRKRGRALCEWDDCTERAIIVEGRITYFCCPEHGELAHREGQALRQMGLSWPKVMGRPTRDAVSGGRPSS